MDLKEQKERSIKAYKEMADKQGFYDSFVVKCIEEYEPKRKPNKLMSIFKR